MSLFFKLLPFSSILVSFSPPFSPFQGCLCLASTSRPFAIPPQLTRTLAPPVRWNGQHTETSSRTLVICPKGEPPVNWVEGVTILVAIVIVACVLVSFLSSLFTLPDCLLLTSMSRPFATPPQLTHNFALLARSDGRQTETSLCWTLVIPAPKESSSRLGQLGQGEHLFAILIVILIGSLNDWQKEMWLEVLDEMREGHTDHRTPPSTQSRALPARQHQAPQRRPPLRSTQNGQNTPRAHSHRDARDHLPQGGLCHRRQVHWRVRACDTRDVRLCVPPSTQSRALPAHRHQAPQGRPPLRST